MPFSIRDLEVFGLGVGLCFLLFLFVVLPIFRRRLGKEVMESKDQFVALASHYLLTPITIIQTALSRLQEADTQLSLEQRMKLYNAIGLGQQRLWIIAEQLVLINEIEQGGIQLREEVADLAEVVSSAVSAMDVFARAKSVELYVQNDAQQPVQTKIDARRVKQAIIAVLDNAIKFSVEGMSVWAEIAVEDNMLVVRVKDQGIGMPEEVMRHLTEKFYRGSSVYSFDYEGLGLGLHIAYAIVRMHGGLISFESKPKQGTIATIQFPN